LFREAGLGQVVGVDPDLGVIHVRVFWGDDEDDGLEGVDLVAIGHLPIGVRGFVRSSPVVVEQRSVPEAAQAHVDAWRARKAALDVDAFGISLWDAVRNVLHTVPRGGTRGVDGLRIESAWLKRDERGAFRIVEAVAVDRR
jgi:hypothetical protein